MAANCAPTGNGGNSTITNQDEAQILARVVPSTPMRAEGYQEDDSHVRQAHREPTVGGS